MLFLFLFSQDTMYFRGPMLPVVSVYAFPRTREEPAAPAPAAGSVCLSCGEPYPKKTTKFCGECGAPREVFEP